MISCVVYGCTSNSITTDACITYHPFPKNELAPQWAEACGWQSSTLDLDTAHICSMHFDDSAYDSKTKLVDSTGCYYVTLKEDAIPTLYLPQRQIFVKDDSLEYGDSVIVYTINSGESNIATISLDDTGEPQIFEIQPSTSNVKLEKLEIRENPLKNEPLDGIGKYEDVSGEQDLSKLRLQNGNLRKGIQRLEEELEVLKKELDEKEKEATKCQKIYKNVEKQITSKKNMLSQDQQKAILSKVFSEAQIKILLGKQKVHWTNDDMAVGYIIRHLGNKRCYGYLKNTLNIPLPGVSSVKRWVTLKKTIRKRS